MKRISFPVLFGALAFALTLRTGAAELVSNGGFETGSFSPWVQGGDTSFTFVGGNPFSGVHAANLGPLSVGTLTQTLSTTPGTNYTLSYYLSNQPDGPNSFAVNWNGTTVGGSTLTNATAFPYQLFSFTVNATAASTPLVFSFSNSGFWYLDNVSVQPLGVVATPDGGVTALLLGAALVGLATLRRRLN